MIFTYLAYGVSGMISLGIISTGLRFLVVPHCAAVGYGVPIEPKPALANAYLAAKGVRDIASGGIVLLLIAFQTPHILGWTLATITLIPIVDAYIVRTHSDSKVFAYGVHGILAIGMLATAALLLTAPV